MENGITYRLANANDIDAINALYNRVYNRNRTADKFIWEFNSAPAGKAIYVIALEGEKVVGTQCAIPYFLINGKGEKSLTAKSEDTLVDTNYRGLKIFDKMYALMIDECRKNDIQLIWGFTYAVKPFKKIGFDIPFESCMGILVLKPAPAYLFLKNLNQKNNWLAKFKINLLCIKSYFDFLRLSKPKHSDEFTEKHLALNSGTLNYLHNSECTGLLLDEAFLNYRLYTNPYSKNNFQFTISQNDKILFSAFYTINNGVGYLLHLFFDTAVKNNSEFIKTLIFKSDLKNCNIIRFWGFNHNSLTVNEVNVLKKCHFTFINRGISFVGLKLSPKLNLDLKLLAVSRLASQGTDQ